MLLENLILKFFPVQLCSLCNSYHSVHNFGRESAACRSESQTQFRRPSATGDDSSSSSQSDSSDYDSPRHPRRDSPHPSSRLPAVGSPIAATDAASILLALAVGVEHFGSAKRARYGTDTSLFGPALSSNGVEKVTNREGCYAPDAQ